MIVGGCSAFGVISGIIASAPSIEDIDATPTGYLTTVLDNQGNQTATLVASGSNRKYVTINEIPINLQHAFVAIEDERFYDHNGIDLQGILRAGLKGVASGFHFSEGASTITQQLLKNTVFTQWTSEQSMADKFERKFQEQYLALQLEKVVDKDWILENPLPYSSETRKDFKKALLLIVAVVLMSLVAGMIDSVLTAFNAEKSL